VYTDHLLFSDIPNQRIGYRLQTKTRGALLV
jgi:hypothetical protein